MALSMRPAASAWMVKLRLSCSKGSSCRPSVTVSFGCQPVPDRRPCLPGGSRRGRCGSSRRCSARRSRPRDPRRRRHRDQHLPSCPRYGHSVASATAVAPTRATAGEPSPGTCPSRADTARRRPPGRSTHRHQQHLVVVRRAARPGDRAAALTSRWKRRCRSRRHRSRRARDCAGRSCRPPAARGRSSAWWRSDRHARPQGRRDRGDQSGLRVQNLHIRRRRCSRRNRQRRVPDHQQGASAA